MSDNELLVDLEHKNDFQFEVDFHQEGVGPLVMDEPKPLGEGRGPNASELLAAAIGNCLSSSAVFCFQKAKVEVKGLHTTVRVAYTRNERGRLRIGEIKVGMELRVKPEDEPRVFRCLELFEDYCVVTQSVRDGLNVKVDVKPVTEESE